MPTDQTAGTSARNRHERSAAGRSARRSSESEPQSKPSGGGRSADEIRETVKEAVGKGVSAVAGVAEGINEKMEETQLPQEAERAIHQVGETANKVVRAAREETDNLRSNFKGQGSGGGQPGQDPTMGSMGGSALQGEEMEGSGYGGSGPSGDERVLPGFQGARIGQPSGEDEED